MTISSNLPRSLTSGSVRDSAILNECIPTITVGRLRCSAKFNADGNASRPHPRMGLCSLGLDLAVGHQSTSPQRCGEDVVGAVAVERKSVVGIDPVEAALAGSQSSLRSPR